jgi:hypothetical protein
MARKSARKPHAALCSVARGEALGRREAKQGQKRVPAFSKHVRVALRHCAPGKTAPYLTAWLRGWDKANLSGMSGFALKDLWPFGKKPAKRHPMSHTVYMMKTKNGSYIPVDRPPSHMVRALAGARRKKRRR